MVRCPTFLEGQRNFKVVSCFAVDIIQPKFVLEDGETRAAVCFEDKDVVDEEISIQSGQKSLFEKKAAF